MSRRVTPLITLFVTGPDDSNGITAKKEIDFMEFRDRPDIADALVKHIKDLLEQIGCPIIYRRHK